jgi:hypothetical protein
MTSTPSIVGQAEFDALALAVEPTDGELIEIKHLLMRELRGKTKSHVALRQAVLAELGVPLETHRRDLYDVPTHLSGSEAIDPDAPPIKRQRVMYGIKLMLADLAAEGLIVQAEPSGSDHIAVPIHRSGTSGSERVPVSSPRVGDAYRLTPGRRQFCEPMLLDAGQFLRGTSDLLDERGKRCLDEALRAARRGLYLSAVNLVGAVSESAWYGIGRTLEAEDPELARAIADNQTAQVQRLVGNILAGARRQRTVVTEILAHAAYLRDLRNYGVHPAEDRDPGQEQAFTEAGCLLLLMQTHRYLARMSEVVTALHAQRVD